MVSATAHPWKLGGPWYRWARPGLPADGRLSAPEIQKYAHPNFVKSFMSEPQRSLMFDPNRDYRSRPSLIANQAGLVRRIGTALEAAKGWAGQKAQTRVLFKQSELKDVRLISSGLLKLYQTVHERFYLVVAELHCDTAGFPSPERDSVCSAGFVLRRRSTVIAGADLQTFDAMLAEIEQARVGLAEVLDEGPLKKTLATRRRETLAAMRAEGVLGAEIEKRKATLAQTKVALDLWRRQKGYLTVVQRWVGLDTADPAAKVGEWRDIPADGADRLRSGVFNEHVLPMRRAYADPANPQHDATGRAIYFGLIPTAAQQHDLSGDDRYHDDDVYEIRCFVRRRRGDCGKLPGDTACKGELVWSEATRPFCLAPALDLEGMANRPVTIRMPDITSLQGQIATAADPSRLASMGFDQPQQLLPKDANMPLSESKSSAGAICFFAIPLITIVALFLLNLFLPIILFVFSLWWMLALKFCIPPSVKVDVGLSAVLDAVPPGIDLTAKLDLQVQMPSGPPRSLKDAMASAIDDVLNNGRPATPAPTEHPSLADSYALLNTANKTRSATGRTGRFLEDNFYPHVSPVWAPKPTANLEAVP